jgi:hypothetical protein
MGGAIFLNGGVLGLNNVTFTNNQARGGNSGASAVGAIGGNGGGGGVGGAGGSGGFGTTPQNGNGGGGGDFGSGGGSGGDGAGGSGGSTGGTGGFGGGGGAGASAGGPGGFGGGGGGGVTLANGGTFGGKGGTGALAHGGGGAGLGGAIFARNGILALQSVSFSNNAATNGSTGGSGATDGQGKGGALFIMSTVTAIYLGSAPSYSSDSASNGGSGTSCSSVVGATAADTNDICGVLTQVTFSATGGSGQAAGTDSYFANYLTAAVSPAIAGLPIAFTGPATGASWIPVVSVNATNASGVVTCCYASFTQSHIIQPFAGDNPGTYTITTSIAGIPISPSYTLTNLAPPNLNVTKTHVGTFTQAGVGEWDIAISNATGSVSTGSFTNISDTLPAGYTVSSFAATDSSWTCNGLNTQTASCFTVAAVKGGSSFPLVRIVVNIPATSPGTVTNTASVYGGNDPVHNSLNNSATASDSVAVVQNPTSIASTAGTPQTVSINQAFATNLQVVVKDAANAVIPNASVTFTAPSTGAGGTFGSPCSGATCVVTTNASGIATAPAFTANGATGSYTVTAKVGNVGPANFSLTNVVVDLTILAIHTGNFSQGQMGATYTITATNSGTGPTIGAVQVVDQLPADLTATAIGGTGWSCVLPTLTCSRSDALAPAGSYPPITLTVTVSSTAAASVTNQATVSGGGEINLANDTATNPTTINPIVVISGQVSVTTTGFVRNHSTGLWSATITVTNTGTSLFSAPIQLVLTNVTAGVTMTNNTGIRNGSPYVTVLGSGSLPAGAATSAVITFNNPNNSFISFTPVTLMGVF